MTSPVSGPRFPVSLKIVFVGHVDHGKSTLIGRILEKTGSLPEGKIESLRAGCAAQGRRFEYAFVLDALAEEQQQNVTIDTTQIQFRTAKRSARSSMHRATKNSSRTWSPARRAQTRP